VPPGVELRVVQAAGQTYVTKAAVQMGPTTTSREQPSWPQSEA
jgi:hypothetical protein